MQDLKKVADLVKQVLLDYPETRDSDMKLYVQIAKLKGCERVPLEDLLLHLKEYGMPQFETIRRSRQKVQEYHPELRASEAVVQIRTDQEQVYIDFGRSRI